MIYRFFRNASFNIFADFSNLISNAIIVILISKFISIDEFGSYNLATTYLTFGLLLSYWGFGNLLTREVAKTPNKFGRYFFNFLVMRFFFSIISFFVILLISSKLNYSQDTNYVIFVVSLGILAETFKNLAYSAFNAFEETHFVSIIFFVSSLFKLSLAYVLLTNNYGIIEIAWLNTVINYLGAISLFFLSVHYLPPIKWKINWKFNIEQTRIAIPLFLIAVLSIAENRLDVIILSGYYSEAVVGLYTAALVLQSGLLIFPDGIRNAIFPVLSKNSIEDPQKASRVYLLLFKYLTLLSLAIAVGGYFLSEKIIIWVYDYSFEESIEIFRVLMLTYPFYSVAILNIRLLNAYNMDKIIVIYFAIDLIITIILSIIIVPIYGGVGAAYIKLITTGLLYGLFYFQVRKLLHDINVMPIILRGLFASIVMVMGLYLVEDWNPFAIILVGFLIYMSTLFLINSFGSEEVTIIKAIFKRKKEGLDQAL